jgi:hypothetical protein
LGVPSLTPGQRLDLAPSQIKDLLECGKDKGLENALFAFADAFTGEYQVMLLIGGVPIKPVIQYLLRLLEAGI